MDKAETFVVMAVIGTILTGSIAIYGELIEKTEVAKTKILDSNTGKYTDKYYERKYTPESQVIPISFGIVIGIMLLFLGIGGMFKYG
jgi:hypothetical protein